MAGLLASLLVRGTGLGPVGDIVGGIVGGIVAAFPGGFIFSLLGYPGITGFNLYSVVVAFVGAVILLVIGRLLFGARRRSTSGS